MAAYDVATSDRSETSDVTLCGRNRANGDALNWIVDVGVGPCGEVIVVVGTERWSELVLIFGTTGRARSDPSAQSALVSAIRTAAAASSGVSGDSSDRPRESIVEPRLGGRRGMPSSTRLFAMMRCSCRRRRRRNHALRRR